ncbi:MAG: hypothetical protein US81_C0009G0018 [Parcubacteria group bacterium GW2011_GWE2_38_18]|nr:MAG: hypothetical protein US81_C0009G0018 [Parcubacteria group bacterium GW2011_GWE2_38_18]
MTLPNFVTDADFPPGSTVPFYFRFLGKWTDDVRRVGEDCPHYIVRVEGFKDLDWSKLPDSGQLVFGGKVAELSIWGRHNLLCNQSDLGRLKKMALEVVYRELHPNEMKLKEYRDRYDKIKADQEQLRLEAEKDGAVLVYFRWDVNQNRWSGGFFKDKYKVVFVLDGKVGNNRKTLENGTAYYCWPGKTPVDHPPTLVRPGFKLIIARKWREYLDLDQAIADLESAISNGHP